MYIIEKLLQLFLKHKAKKKNIKENIEACEHLFIPIDSSGEILACSKCGMVIKSKNLQNKQV